MVAQLLLQQCAALCRTNTWRKGTLGCPHHEPRESLQWTMGSLSGRSALSLHVRYANHGTSSSIRQLLQIWPPAARTRSMALLTFRAISVICRVFPSHFSPLFQPETTDVEREGHAPRGPQRTSPENSNRSAGPPKAMRDMAANRRSCDPHPGRDRRARISAVQLDGFGSFPVAQQGGFPGRPIGPRRTISVAGQVAMGRRSVAPARNTLSTASERERMARLAKQQPSFLGGRLGSETPGQQQPVGVLRVTPATTLDQPDVAPHASAAGRQGASSGGSILDGTAALLQRVLFQGGSQRRVAPDEVAEQDRGPRAGQSHLLRTTGAQGGSHAATLSAPPTEGQGFRRMYEQRLPAHGTTTMEGGEAHPTPPGGVLSSEDEGFSSSNRRAQGSPVALDTRNSSERKGLLARASHKIFSKFGRALCVPPPRSSERSLLLRLLSKTATGAETEKSPAANSLRTQALAADKPVEQ